MQQYPIVLTIAGSDSSGGAGIQADIKTISALGCYAASVVTAVTAQNTLGVTAVHAIPPAMVTAQIKAIMEDIPPHAIKTGMLPDADTVQAVVHALEYANIPLVVDPVMKASSGHALTKEGLAEAIKTILLPVTTLVTPNLNEAEVLTGLSVTTVPDMKKAAEKILAYGCKAVLVKGGHLTGGNCVDVYLDQTGNEETFEAPIISSPNLHGTGCTLSAAITSFLALHYPLTMAIAVAKTYIGEAIEAGKLATTGAGSGPLNHFFRPQPLAAR